MKTVIVGASKFLIAFMIVFMLLGMLALWWFTFGVRPLDRFRGRINAVMKTDPDKALAMYPQLFEIVDKNKMSVEDYGNTYAGYGYFLKDHLRYREAIDAFRKAAANTEKGWQGITRANALVAAAQCQLEMDSDYKPGQADFDAIMQAAPIHATRESGDDKWFWPAYDQTLGRMYGRTGDLDKAIASLEKAADEYHRFESPWCASDSRGAIIDALVRKGKYAEANKKFIEWMKACPDGDYTYSLPGVLRNSLARAQDKDPGFFRRALAVLEAKKFKELDKLAEEKQASKTNLATGRLPVDDLYAALASMDDRNFDRDWQARLALLEEWASACPQSATAKVAQADLLADYAWKARGSGYSDTVSAQGWKLFEERLKQSMAVLDRVKDRPPEWYTAAQRCALGQGWPMDRYNAMVDECRKRYPGYAPVVFKKCHFLLPRWHGEAGDLESYLSAEANKTGGTAGDIMYAQAAWYLDIWIGNVMTSTSLSWPRVRAGMLADIKAHPKSLVARGELSILAMQANDEKTALSAFDQNLK